jgi:hypothetical protein
MGVYVCCTVEYVTSRKYSYLFYGCGIKALFNSKSFRGGKAKIWKTALDLKVLKYTCVSGGHARIGEYHTSPVTCAPGEGRAASHAKRCTM